jgi:hypothetical protein
MFSFGDRQRVKQLLVERLRRYFASVPGASPEEFLLEAVAREIDHRERTLNNGQPCRASAESAHSSSQSTFRPSPKATLATDDIHPWLCEQLAKLHYQRQYHQAEWCW